MAKHRYPFSRIVMHGLRSYIKWSMILYEHGGSSDVSKPENRPRMFQRDKNLIYISHPDIIAFAIVI